MLFFFGLLKTVLSTCEYSSMSIGHFNITSERQLKEVMKKEPIFILGPTSLSCESCCKSETFYKSIVDTLENYRPKIPFIRIDVDSSSFIKPYLIDGEGMPQLYGVRKGEIFRFYDLQDINRVLLFLDRLLSPVLYMSNLEEIQEFLTPPIGKFSSLKIFAVLYDSDLKEEFEKAVASLPNWFSTDIRGVTDKTIIKQLKQSHSEVKYLNSVLLWRPDELKVLDLELPHEIKKWIMSNCVGLAEELTPYNFHMYQASSWPMFIMFTDPKNDFHNFYLDLFRKVARKFDEQVKFMWLDGTQEDYIKKKNTLGLATEILPAFAFNSRRKVNHPYPEAADITEANLDRFVQDYLDGKKSTYKSEMPPDTIRLDECERVDTEDFKEKVLSEGTDVLFFVYSSHNSKESEKVAPVFNKVCKRFQELDYPNLKIFVVDASKQLVHKTVNVGKLPMAFFASAYKKSDIFEPYKGNYRVLDIMKFVEKKAGVKFVLPELSHLSAEEVEEYESLKNQDL